MWPPFSAACFPNLQTLSSVGSHILVLDGVDHCLLFFLFLCLPPFSQTRWCLIVYVRHFFSFSSGGLAFPCHCFPFPMAVLFGYLRFRCACSTLAHPLLCSLFPCLCLCLRRWSLCVIPVPLWHILCSVHFPVLVSVFEEMKAMCHSEPILQFLEKLTTTMQLLAILLVADTPLFPPLPPARNGRLLRVFGCPFSIMGSSTNRAWQCKRSHMVHEVEALLRAPTDLASPEKMLSCLFKDPVSLSWTHGVPLEFFFFCDCLPVAFGVC